jgi:hypothetical protein
VTSSYLVSFLAGAASILLEPLFGLATSFSAGCVGLKERDILPYAQTVGSVDIPARTWLFLTSSVLERRRLRSKATPYGNLRTTILAHRDVNPYRTATELRRQFLLVYLLSLPRCCTLSLSPIPTSLRLLLLLPSPPSAGGPHQHTNKSAMALPTFRSLAARRHMTKEKTIEGTPGAGAPGHENVSEGTLTPTTPYTTGVNLKRATRNRRNAIIAACIFFALSVIFLILVRLLLAPSEHILLTPPTGPNRQHIQ